MRNEPQFALLENSRSMCCVQTLPYIGTVSESVCVCIRVYLCEYCEADEERCQGGGLCAHFWCRCVYECENVAAIDWID